MNFIERNFLLLISEGDKARFNVPICSFYSFNIYSVFNGALAHLAIAVNFKGYCSVFTLTKTG
jgi:hypothetical protein